MWADLSLEPKLITEDNDDAWFCTSHSFHQLSARHLRSAFAHPDVGNDLLNFNLQGICSPQLPSSVSKSRGKDYRSKDCGRNFCQISSNKSHPVNELGGRILTLDMVANQDCKSKVSHGIESDACTSITSVVDDSERRVALNSQSASTSGVSTSTITTVSWHGDSKSLGMPKAALEHTSDLLNALRTNLRKSCATRPALRVEISDNKESKGCKSSTGKSSVGSSSNGNDVKGEGSTVVPKTDCCNQMKGGMNDNIGYKGLKTSISDDKISKGRKSSVGKSSVGSSSTGKDTKGKGSAVMPKTDRCKRVKVGMNANIGSKDLKTSGTPSSGFSYPKLQVKKMAAGVNENKDRFLKARDFGKLAKSVNGTEKAKKMSDTSVGTMTSNAYSSKIEPTDAAVSSSKHVASKSMISHQTTQKIFLNRSRTRAQGVNTKLGSSQCNEYVCRGKENVRRSVWSHKSDCKGNVHVVRVSDHKVPKLKSKNKVGVTSIVPKVRIGKMNDGVAPRDTRVYLR